MMTRTRIIGLLVFLAACLPLAGLAQEAHTGFQQSRGGWIGISVDFTRIEGEDVSRTTTVITQVVPGSPAEAAGLKVGDTVLHLDGQPVSERSFAALPGTLNPGDLVRFTIQRDGRSRELLVEAAPRPFPFPAISPDLQEMVVRLDTVRGAILQNLDSIRINIAGLHGSSLHVDTTLGNISLRIRQFPLQGNRQGDWTVAYRMIDPSRDSTALRPGAFWPGGFFTEPDIALPFESLAVRTAAADSLRHRITQLRQTVTRVRREQLSRQREIETSTRGSVEEAVRLDPLMRELRAREGSLVAEQARLTERLSRVSEQEIQRQWAEAQARYEEALARMVESQAEAHRRGSRQWEEAAFRPPEMYVYSRGGSGSPVLAGQSVMLGAHLAPLNPDLAAIFSVPEGVFVIQVPESTPAADAGLLGGDIIVRIGDEKVASLTDLRFGLGARGGSLRMQVIRRGEPVEIVVRR